MKCKGLKKWLAGTCAVVLLAGSVLTGCGDDAKTKKEGDSSTEENGTTANDSAGDEEESSGEEWEKASFTLGGGEITLPIEYSEFVEKTGYSLPKDQEEMMLGGNMKADERMKMMAVNEDGDEVLLKFRNYNERTSGVLEEDEGALKYKDAVVYGVVIEGYTDFNTKEINSNQTFALWDELKMGDKIDKLDTRGEKVLELSDGADWSAEDIAGVDSDRIRLRFYNYNGETKLGSATIERGKMWESIDEH